MYSSAPSNIFETKRLLQQGYREGVAAFDARPAAEEFEARPNALVFCFIYSGDKSGFFWWVFFLYVLYECMYSSAPSKNFSNFWKGELSLPNPGRGIGPQRKRSGALFRILWGKIWGLRLPRAPTFISLSLLSPFLFFFLSCITIKTGIGNAIPP